MHRKLLLPDAVALKRLQCTLRYLKERSQHGHFWLLVTYGQPSKSDGHLRWYLLVLQCSFFRLLLFCCCSSPVLSLLFVACLLFLLSSLAFIALRFMSLAFPVFCVLSIYLASFYLFPSLVLPPLSLSSRLFLFKWAEMVGCSTDNDDRRCLIGV